MGGGPTGGGGNTPGRFAATCGGRPGPYPMHPFAFALLTGLAVWTAYVEANSANEEGHYWTGMVSGLLGAGTLGIGVFGLLRTDIAIAGLVLGLFMSVRLAIELGFSFSEIISPD